MGSPRGRLRLLGWSSPGKHGGVLVGQFGAPPARMPSRRAPAYIVIAHDAPNGHDAAQHDQSREERDDVAAQHVGIASREWVAAVERLMDALARAVRVGVADEAAFEERLDHMAEA